MLDADPSIQEKNGRKRAVFVRPKTVHPQSDDAETKMGGLP
jgi:hypothetical protein